ncbi:MAG: hypothetical protein ACI9BH_002534 [Paracoccaceae bacterium]|jgi:hypothetical protein
MGSPYILIWAVFVGWASFFHCCGEEDGNLLGLISGKIAGAIVANPAGKHKHSGGCDHVHTWSDAEPIDNHTCHCLMC